MIELLEYRLQELRQEQINPLFHQQEQSFGVDHIQLDVHEAQSSCAPLSLRQLGL